MSSKSVPSVRDHFIDSWLSSTSRGCACNSGQHDWFLRSCHCLALPGAHQALGGIAVPAASHLHAQFGTAWHQSGPCQCYFGASQGCHGPAATAQKLHLCAGSQKRCVLRYCSHFYIWRANIFHRNIAYRNCRSDLTGHSCVFAVFGGDCEEAVGSQPTLF